MKIYRYALKELIKHMSRTGTTVFGYMIGVILIVLVLSTVQSQNHASTTILSTTGTHFMVFATDPTCCANMTNESAGGIFAEGVFTHPLDEKVLEAVQNMSGVRDAAPYLLYKRFQRGINATVSIGGVEIDSLSTYTCVNSVADVTRGRYLQRTDNDSVILEESFARFQNYNINETVNAFGRELKIVGIVNSGIRPGKADMYAPLTVVRQIVDFLEKGRLDNIKMNIILVEVADARQMEDVMAQVKDLLDKATISGYNCYKPARNAISISDNGAWMITAVIMIVVVLFAFKSQYASVVERTREIGILKSIGWVNGRLIAQIIIESLVQAVSGVILGCVLAVLIIFLYPWSDLSFTNITLAVYYPAIGLALALALVGGIVAGIVPAWKAGRLNPAEALRRGGGGI